MILARWATGLVLVAFGALIAVGNWSLIARFALRRKRGSLVPFLGGGAMAAGIALLPIAHRLLLALLALAVDPGCLLTLLLLILTA